MVLFVPSIERDGETPVNQEYWVEEALEIFRDLSNEEALVLLQMCQQKSFEAGEIVWCPGDPGEDMLALLSGMLHVVDSEARLIGEVQPGASFGEMAYLSGSPRFVGFQAVRAL